MLSAAEVPARRRPDRQAEPTFVSRLFRYVCCRHADSVEVDHSIHVKNALAKYSSPSNASSISADGYLSREQSEASEDLEGHGREFGAFNPRYNPSEHGGRGAGMDPRERDLPSWRRSDRTDLSSRSSSFRIHEPGRPLSVISEGTLETSRSGYGFERSQSRIITRENSRQSSPRSTVSHRHGPGGGEGGSGSRHQRAASSTTASALPSPRTEGGGGASSFSPGHAGAGSAHSTPLRAQNAAGGLTLRQNSGNGLGVDKRASPPAGEAAAAAAAAAAGGGGGGAGGTHHKSSPLSESRHGKPQREGGHHHHNGGGHALQHPAVGEHTGGRESPPGERGEGAHPPSLTSEAPPGEHGGKVHSPTPSRAGSGGALVVPMLHLHPR